MIAFFVAGKPEPAGSKRAFPIRRKGGGVVGVSVVDANPNAKDWKTTVAWTARRVYDGPLLDEPLRVRFVFFVNRPASHYGTGKNSGTVKKNAPSHPKAKPDVLKLGRAVEDALTGVIWTDDAIIVHETLEKRWDTRIGVEVTIEPVRQDAATDPASAPMMRWAAS